MSRAGPAARAWAATTLLAATTILAGPAGERGFLGWHDLEHVVHAERAAIIRVPAAALVLSGLSGGTLETSVMTSVLPAGENQYRVTVLTQLEGPSLPESPETEELHLDLFVYAMRGSEVVAQTSQSLGLELARHGATLREGGLKVLSTIDLPAGRYSLRVLVQDHESGEFGLRVRPLALPPAPEAIAPNSPWILDPSRDWVVALSDGVPEDASLRPVLLEAERYLPHAAPVLRTGGVALGCLLVPSGSAVGARAAVRFHHREGLRIAEIPATVVARLESPWPGLEAIVVELQVPDLPLGRYWLRLAFHHAAGDVLESLGTPVVVAPGATPTSLSDSAPEAPSERLEHPAALRRARAELKAGGVAEEYRGALLLLASGDRERAAAAILGLERRLTRNVPAAILLDVEDLQWQTFERLAERRWQRLLPVALLYLDLANDYRAQSLFPLADHAMRVASRLSHTLAKTATTTEDRVAAAQLLASLAGQLQRQKRLRESDALFERALELDPGSIAVRMGLAASHEQQGRYPEVVRALSPLLEHSPEQALARLRLAINLRRTGEASAALDLLNSLADSADAPWIAALASQQSAAAEIEAGQFEVAEKRLRRAIVRFPHRSALRVQLARLLESQGQVEESRKLIESLLLLGPAAADSARYRYSQWPRQALSESRQRLRERERQHLTELQRLLSGEAPAVTR